MSIIIYRIQDKHGRGPWKPGFSHRWVQTREDHNNLHPWYVEFGELDFSSFNHCAVGCLSVEQLRRWFSQHEYKTLLKYGYNSVKICVDEIIATSDIQTVFSRKKPLFKDVLKIKLY